MCETTIPARKGPAMPRAGTAFNLYLPDETRALLERQASRLRRSLHAEILHAIERHLAAPPVLTVPALPGATHHPRRAAAALHDASPADDDSRGARKRKGQA
jgi:hypothetical protein